MLTDESLINWAASFVPNDMRDRFVDGLQAEIASRAQPKILENGHTWSVVITLPAGTLDKHGKERRYAHNDTVTVVARSAARAIEMVTVQWPRAQVWTVNHIGSRTILMLDGPAPTELPGEGGGT